MKMFDDDPEHLEHPELVVGMNRIYKRRLNGSNHRLMVHECEHRHRPPLCCGKIFTRPMTESEHLEYHSKTSSPWRFIE